MSSHLKIVISSKDNPVSPAIINSMYRLRHEAFGKRLQWEVTEKDGMEFDRFDNEDVHYLLATMDDGNVKGCWRFLPTNGPNMLKDVFPQLLGGEHMPSDENVWEISRFAIDHRTTKRTVRGMVNYMTLEMIRAGIEFGRNRGVKAFVFVTTVAVERMLKQLGIQTRRMGGGQAVMIGKVKTVALWLDIDEELSRAIH